MTFSTFWFNLSIALAVLLAACSRNRTGVGPVCISCKPYFCRGSWHHPQDFYEYDVTGIASWYGGDFHGKPKATGELFDKMAFTAAHKTLPLPTVVKVTSLHTGKSIVVVVDDRGPFVYKGRVIDLSYKAAEALGIHNMKPSAVRIQSLVRDSLKLSYYISANCNNKKKDKFGRSWSQIYMQEIAKTQPRKISSGSTKQIQKNVKRLKDNSKQKASIAKRKLIQKI